jgi:transcription antitermination protein NusB
LAESEPTSERTGRPSATRSKARKRALDILFEAELRDNDTLATLEARSADADPPVRAYTTDLVTGVVAHRAEIDARIAACLSPGWTLERLPRVDRNVLRIAVFEIDHAGVPAAIAVTEAVQLVSDLSTDESPAFVHGVLGTITSNRVA